MTKIKQFINNNILSILLFMFSFNVLSISAVNSAESSDFSDVNLKSIFIYTSADRFKTIVEVENIAKKGNFQLYGFTDVILSGSTMMNSYDELQFDFYKYILKYDITQSSEKLFINALMKETYKFKGDLFLGLGTHVNIPLIGRLNMNAYYFTSGHDSNNRSRVPFSFGFDWFNLITKLNDDISLYHKGWSDLDLFTKVKYDSNSRSSFQFYEGLSVENKSYAVAVAYKYFYTDVKHKVSHNLIVELTKKF
jgi:nucleoside-specific outer membrane channel protein Tsx